MIIRDYSWFLQDLVFFVHSEPNQIHSIPIQSIPFVIDKHEKEAIVIKWYLYDRVLPIPDRAGTKRNEK